MTVYLNIGSNMGNRQALIERVVALIIDAYPSSRVRRSAFIESEPWGYDSTLQYLNLGLALDFHEAIDPFEILNTMQGIERKVSDVPHRDAQGAYRDREIDIDIIAIGDIRVDTPVLTLPHPRAHLRHFVTEPLRQLGYNLALLEKGDLDFIDLVD